MKKSVGDRLMKFCDILSLWWVGIIKNNLIMLRKMAQTMAKNVANIEVIIHNGLYLTC